MTFFMTYDPAPCDKKYCSEHYGYLQQSRIVPTEPHSHLMDTQQAWIVPTVPCSHLMDTPSRLRFRPPACIRGSLQLMYTYVTSNTTWGSIFSPYQECNVYTVHTEHSNCS